MNASMTPVTDEARRLANRKQHDDEEARMAKLNAEAATAEGMPDHTDHPGNGAD